MQRIITRDKGSKDISVVIPVFNEKDSLHPLYENLIPILEQTEKSFEIILINDGSNDGSAQTMDELSQYDPRIKTVHFKTNKGKAKGLAEGFNLAEGEIIFTMDADLQDDPREIPNFLAKLEQGFDLVSGWKRKRHDPLEKRLPSKFFNGMTSLVTGLKLHDFNCGFKAYRREILADIKVYGELHRYIPALAHWKGYRIGEIPVQHHARQFGSSKYGLERYLRGLFDLCTVVLLTRFMQTPLYLFGISGAAILGAGLLALGYITGLQLIYGSILGHKPLSYFGVLSVLFGSQLIATGLIAEMLNNIRSRHEEGISLKNIFECVVSVNNPQISVVIPIHNEKDNMPALFDSLNKTLPKLETYSEVIIVNDGSTDGSEDLCYGLAERNNLNIRIVNLRKRFGKASALQKGFSLAKGQTIVTMDGDLQDNPENIPELLEELDKGSDMVLARRTSIPFPRSLFSRIFNLIASTLMGHKLHDLNCGLKAFKNKALTDIRLYGELQRFFPFLVAKNGFNVKEIPVPHRERYKGSSKYGFSRIPKAFLDLIGVVLVTDYRSRPLHLFGLIGLIIGGTGFLINLYLTLHKVVTGTIGSHYTLLLMGVMLMVLGLQWFSTGLLGEAVNRLHQTEFE